ncbi:hypothetical protein M433DRAFT_160964 [Acidomyces richmondensis BFW]|nr:hypothetical protein M433DRAFT_160964 [Acidomyces richmondensis BFW]
MIESVRKRLLAILREDSSTAFLRIVLSLFLFEGDVCLGFGSFLSTLSGSNGQMPLLSYADSMF